MNAMVEEAVVEAYWMPGCSSCLRMKEFIERSGRPYRAINVDADPEAMKKVLAYNLLLPVACIGDRCVNGVDLSALAELLGIDYEPPVMLTPQELAARYDGILETGMRHIGQMTPELLASSLPDRERPMSDVAVQVASVARAFLSAYYDDVHKTSFYSPDPTLATREALLARAAETRTLMRDWWEEDGQDDPLDRVTKTYWGYPTLHEIMEREVWHTAQHTRQLAYALEQAGLTVDGPLSPQLLEGLPIPERIHD